MKATILEHGDETGEYNFKTDEYEYNGDYDIVESSMKMLGDMTVISEMELSIEEIENGLVGGETRQKADEEDKSQRLKSIISPLENIEIDIDQTDKTNKHSILVVNDGIVDKRRVYIDSPEEAPDWADVQEGDRDPDALYYETKPSVSSGEIPEFLDPQFANSTESISESTDDRRGRYASSMKRHNMGNNRTVYSKSAQPKHMIGEFMSDTVFEELGIEAPAVAYDPDENRIYKEGIEGDTIAQLTGATELGVRTSGREAEDLDEESYVEQAAAMLLTGNDDLNSGNLVADSEGEFWVIDNDNLGSRNINHNPWDAGALVDCAMDYAKSMGIDIDKDMIKEQVRELADRVSDEDGNVNQEFLDAIEEAGNNPIDDGARNTHLAIKENIEMNVEAINEQKLQWSI